MFTVDGVTLRPLELSDLETAYAWHCDLDLDLITGWGRRQSLAAFEQRFTTLVTTPPEEHRFFGITVDDRLIGRVDLASIDLAHRQATLGYFLGARDAWGKGYAKTAVRIALDYAFSAENLDRVFAHVFGFNTRSMGLLKRLHFTAEGILRQHELHNGARHDIHVFGMLKPEFYASHPTLFTIPI